jgi:predicted transposase/invertase (TIGR01784 family)
LYDRAAVSLAILADDNEDWYESVYFNKTWGCLTLFRFPVAKILDYKNQHDALEVSDNPFAVVVAAHLRTLETKGDTASRRIRKIELTKNLYRRGFKKQDILNLYRFIDWIMVLPEELEESYHQEIAKFEEERKMRYITTAERIGMKKGIEKGVKNTAKNMLKIGLDIGLISRVTGLSEAEIRKLPKERDAEQEHVFAG